MLKELNIECDEQITIERFNNVYEELVNETENPATLHNARKNDRLRDLLRLFEYLRGEEENPLDDWFA